MKKKILTPKRLLSGLLSFAVAFTMVPATSMETKAAEISNPRIVEDSSMESGQKVIWDCIYFGFYPQTEIVGEASQCGTVRKDFGTDSDYVEDQLLYRKLLIADYDNNGDTTIGGDKYRRIKKYVTEDENPYYENVNASHHYYWSDSSTYHYFRYEMIKWRVLSTDGKTALLLADKVLDDQEYNTNYTEVTWETSSIRSWLNGYGSSDNVERTDYSSNNFIDSAFNSAQQAAIKSTTLVNDDNSYYGSEGGNDTTDKLFLLSLSEANDTETAKSYGFLDDEKRQCTSSTYAKAMGLYMLDASYDKIEDTRYCNWWLRTSGDDNCTATRANYYGIVGYSGSAITSREEGVRPALKLDLSSAKQYQLYSYAGTACSDGSYEYIKTPKKVKFKKIIAGRGKITIKLPYKPNERGATKYQIAYRKKGSSKWKKITTSSKTKTIKKLKKGKRYYVKIRAYKTGLQGKRYGAWSKTKLSKKIK